MEWARENWIWILVFAVFIGMHLFGHGGHGGHTRGGSRKEGDEHQGHSGASDPEKERKGGGGCH